MHITTSHKLTPATRDRARRLADALGGRFVERRQATWREPTLIVGRTQLTVRVGDDVFAWHPGLLHARLEAGFEHPMIRAGDVRPGDRILDTTCGLATDAAFLGTLAEHPVVSLEATPVLALVTGVGVRAAGLPVRVVCARSDRFLEGLPDDCFDAVYCDPLFRPGRKKNPSLQLYREVGDPWRPGEAWLAQARRVARRVVVIKDEVRGDLLEQLQPSDVFTGIRSQARYGRFPT